MASISRDEVMATLQEILRTEFANPDLVITPKTTAQDIAGWNSHKQVEIILACEDAFNIRLKPREINAMENIDEMVGLLVKHINR